MPEPQQQSSFLVWLVLGVIAVVAAGVFMVQGGPPARAAAQTGTAARGRPLEIAVIPKGTTHEFWQSIHAGAIKAEREATAAGTPVHVIWKGPLKEDDRGSQIDVVQTFVGQRVDGMVLAPLDRTALVAPTELAVGAGIPVVIIDSGLESGKQTSFIATNNLVGGRLGGQRLGEVLGGKGKVILLRYQEGSASTEQREAGFLEAMKRFPGIELISTDQHAGATRDTALTASQNLLNRFKGEATGIFTPNESSTAGMALALKELGLAGTIKHVGFDASGPLLAALKANAIQGLVVQDPFNMGYLGVKTVLDAIAGRPVQQQIDTPVQLVTPENLGEPAISALVDPPLAQYLTEPASR